MDALTSPLLHGRQGPPTDPAVTAAEAAGLVDLARARGVQSIAIGSGRDLCAVRSAQDLAAAWRRSGGEVVLELTWPETAASWLRQANRFAAADADAWIMLGPAQGWAQMTRRLLWSTHWKPTAALLAAAVSAPGALDLVGRHNLPGIAGVTNDGEPWHLGIDDRVVMDRKDRP